MPWIQGKNMSPKICGYMKMVTLLADVNGGKQLLTKSNQYFYAKDVFNIAPSGVVKDPTSEKIIHLIEQRQATRPAKSAAERVIRRGGREVVTT
jgi:hypothetical protein